MRKITLSLFLIVCTSIGSYAQSDVGSPNKNSPLALDYSLFDYPFAIYAGRTVNSTVSDSSADVKFFQGMGYSSMEQALQVYTGINRSASWGISKIPLFEARPVLNIVSQIIMMSVYDFAIYAFPLPYISQGWLHEEWHRSVMVSAYVNSYNPFTLFKKENISGEGAYAVGYVLDENLVTMKANNSANLARMSAAGGEAQLAAVAQMQKYDFFFRRYLPQSVNYVLNTLNVIDYMRLCSDKEVVTTRTLEQIEKDKDNQEFRDAKGYDFTAWAYDLFNPDLPYSARGLNVYGNGFDRYIYGDKLTDAQYVWIGKQARLAFISYFSPMNLFISGIRLGRRDDGSYIWGNFAFRYFPTSFGNMLGLEVFYQSADYNLRIGAHLNQNYEHSFPGIEAELIDKPISIAGSPFLATAHLVADLQPKDQNFFASEMSFAGLLGATLKWKMSKNFYPYLAVEGKTKGWVQGNEFLDESISVEIGLSSLFGN
jgi:hypothetical protein